MADNPIDTLRAVRPKHDDTAAPMHLVDAIVATDVAPARTHRLRRPLAGLAAVAAIAIIAAAISTRGSHPIDIALVASASRAALDSGRATVDFASNTHGGLNQSGTEKISFSGDDVEMTIDFASDGRSPGFQAQNKTVDGEFYLLDGPIGLEHWIHDTNASGMSRKDIFSLDPRTLLDLLSPSADFEQVGEADGVRHLRARSVDGVPVLNLGLGPTDGQDTSGLEVWVGRDDVVQRIDLAYDTTEVSEHSGALAKIVRHADGTVTKEIDPAHPGHREVYRTHSTYSARFTDVGAPIAITAPTDSTDVAGKG